MPDLFKEYGIPEFDESFQTPKPEEAPQEPEKTENAEQTEKTEESPKTPGLSRRTRIIIGAAAAAVVAVIAAVVGFSKYQDQKAVDRCREALADFQNLSSYHVQETTKWESWESTSIYWKTDDGVLQLNSSNILVELADGQCFIAEKTDSSLQLNSGYTVSFVQDPRELEWEQAIIVGSAGPFWLSEYEWQDDDVAFVSREKTGSGESVVLLFDGDPTAYDTGEISEYTVCFRFDTDGALTSTEITYTLLETEYTETAELIPTSQEEIEQTFLHYCQPLMYQLEAENTYFPLCQAALEDFRSSNVYHVTQVLNSSTSELLSDGKRQLYTTFSGYRELLVDELMYVCNTAGLWTRSTNSGGEVVIEWLSDYVWAAWKTRSFTVLEATETADGQSITLLVENDDYWKSDDSSYTVCFTLNNQGKLTQLSFAYTIFNKEYTRTCTILDTSEEEITAAIDDAFLDAALESSPTMAPLNLCRASILALAEKESFHIFGEFSRGVGDMQEVYQFGNSYWCSPRGASQWYTIENGEQKLYSLALYENGIAQFQQINSNISGSGSVSWENTADDLIASYLPQYDWLSNDLTILATEATEVGKNITFQFLEQGTLTIVCFSLDKSNNLISITETVTYSYTDSVKTTTYRILSTDVAEITSAIDGIAAEFV